jgi:hypothetical protein
MGKISEPQFKDYARNGAITTLKIIEAKEGYLVVATLSWKEGDYTLYSQRNRPRAWVSLDRLIKYLRAVAPTLQTITLELSGEER